MKDLHATNEWIKRHGDLAIDMIRIYLGIGLVIKGIYFLSHSDYLLQMITQGGTFGFSMAAILHYIAFAHVIGGAALAVGFLTRFAAIVQLPILFCALFFVHAPQMIVSVESRQSLEFAGLVFFLLILISVYGAGRWSLDHLMQKRGLSAQLRYGTS